MPFQGFDITYVGTHRLKGKLPDIENLMGSK